MRSIRSRSISAWVIAAIALTAVAQLELWLLWMPDPDEATGPIPLAIRGAAALGTAPLTVSLGFGRRWPWVSVVAAIPAVAVLPAGPLETSVAVAIAIAIAAYRSALWAHGSTELAFGGVALLGVVGATFAVHPGTVDEMGDLVLLLLVLLGPWLAGLSLRSRRVRVGELESAAARSEAVRRSEAATAVTDERARIARELHDVVAHGISVIVLQARGARRTIRSDPAAATQALDEIETTATRALAEMRRLVGVLRPGPEGGGLEPPPGLGQLETLVAGVRDAGLDVDVRVEGETIDLAPGVDLAAYRLVQEALTNTLRHASATVAHVVVRYLPDAIEVEVVDEGSTAPGGGRAIVGAAPAGHGMIGMRERAALYGGSVEYGPRPDGGFGVRARLPIAGDGG